MTHDPAVPAAAWRDFGQRAGLDLDFSDTDRPGLVTRVLSACCAQPVDPARLWSLTLAERIGALARILMLSEGGEALELQLRCAGCREALELAVPYAALLQEAERSRDELVIDARCDESRSLRLRRPNGEDQRAWRASAFGTAEEAIAAIVGRLTVSPSAEPAALGAADLEHLAEAMESFDPLVCFQVTTTCPSCDSESVLPVDLEAMLLARLHVRQQRLLEQVHRLAAFYGWTEDEVLAVPARRREQYLRLMQHESGSR